MLFVVFSKRLLYDLTNSEIFLPRFCLYAAIWGYLKRVKFNFFHVGDASGVANVHKQR